MHFKYKNCFVVGSKVANFLFYSLLWLFCLVLLKIFYTLMLYQNFNNNNNIINLKPEKYYAILAHMYSY